MYVIIFLENTLGQVDSSEQLPNNSQTFKDSKTDLIS